MNNSSTATTTSQAPGKPGYVRFPFNTPQRIAFKSLDGPLVDSQYNGKQIMLQCVDGRRAYLAPDVVAKLKEMGVKPADLVEVQYVKDSVGTKWLLQRLPQPAAQLAENAPEDWDEPKPGLPPVRLEAALKTAVYAAVQAERYGESLNYSVRFTPSDIRAMAISVLIGMNQDARRLGDGA